MPWLIPSVQAATGANASVSSKKLNELERQLNELSTDLDVLTKRIVRLEVQQGSLPIEVDVSGAPTIGKRNAKVAIVEFADYQCPYCRKFQKHMFPLLDKSYIETGKVVFIVKNFPLNIHPQAMKAATALFCAGRQGIHYYWEIEDYLFRNQEKLGHNLYRKLPKLFGLDGERYGRCRNSKSSKNAVIDELHYGESIGITGTPTFFVGRYKGGKVLDAVRLDGIRQFVTFKQLIATF